MTVEMTSEIKQRFEIVEERINSAAARAGINAAGIKLVVVTKQKSAQVVQALVELGLSSIGESYLNEAQFKMELLQDLPIEWHMIGTIQKGKEKQVANDFDVIHSLDRLRLAERISQQAVVMERVIPAYLEFNVSGEPTKQGWNAKRTADWEKLLPEVERILSLPGLDVKGLMTMAPYSLDPESARPYFRKLRELRDYLKANLKTRKLNGLSMGMSGDFEIAIEEGATILRIGTALVGERG
jgi:pyridoxal phosphate enzyme (YggS family)